MEINVDSLEGIFRKRVGGLGKGVRREEGERVVARQGHLFCIYKRVI